jgi:hypothetical protein
VSFSLRRALVAVRSLLIGPPTKTLNASLPPNVKAALRLGQPRLDANSRHRALQNSFRSRRHGCGPPAGAVTSQVILPHPSRREASLEGDANALPIQCGYLLYAAIAASSVSTTICLQRADDGYPHIAADDRPPLPHRLGNAEPRRGQRLGRGWDETAFLVASGTCLAAISWPLMGL